MIEKLVRRDDPTGIAARYIVAAGDDSYASAFGKMLSDPTTGHLRFTPQEVEAVRLVSAVQAERALAEGAPGTGGFALPVDLDPTVLLASDGAINPIRQLATVHVTGSYVWHGVSSVGVTAAYAAEGTEVGDGAPALLGPIIYPEMARCFVPFSFEVGQDFAGLQAEMAKLFADARDVLEAQAFLDGAGHGSTEPEGILTGLIAATGMDVPTASADTLVYSDVYALVQAVPPRWQPSSTVLAAPAVFDEVHQMIGGGSTTNLPILPLREGPICGRAKREWSTMSVETTTDDAIVMIAGDVAAAYRVIDRIGMTVELVSHLLGPSYGYPTGQRGLLAYWRGSAGCVVPNAARYLQILSKGI